jgi:hypothetical protein
MYQTGVVPGAILPGLGTAVIRSYPTGECGGKINVSQFLIMK